MDDTGNIPDTPEPDTVPPPPPVEDRIRTLESIWVLDSERDIRTSPRRIIQDMTVLDTRVKDVLDRLNRFEAHYIEPDHVFEEWLHTLCVVYYMPEWESRIRGSTALIREYQALHIAWQHAYSPKAGPRDKVVWHDDFARVRNRMKEWSSIKEPALEYCRTHSIDTPVSFPPISPHPSRRTHELP